MSSFPQHPSKWMSVSNESVTSPEQSIRYLRRHYPDIPDFSEYSGAICIYQSSLLKDVLESFSTRKLLHVGCEAYEVLFRDSRILCYQCRGIGAPTAAVQMEQMIALGLKRFISIGTAGALCRSAEPGSLVLCTRAIRDEGTSHHYVSFYKYVDADDRMLTRLRSALDRQCSAHIAGMTWTTDAPYRETAEEISAYHAEGAITVEMEAAALIAVARFRGVEFAAAFCISDVVMPTCWIPSFKDPYVERGLKSLFSAALSALVT